MENLDACLDGKTIDDLTYADAIVNPTNGSNLIEPSESMIDQVIDLILLNTSVVEIKKNVKDLNGKKLSFGQIAQIKRAIDSKRNQLLEAGNEDEDEDEDED